MKIDILYITESELEIMDILWQVEKPVTLADLGNALAHHGWKNGTLHTLAGRLVKKGLLVDVQVSGKNLYLPLFSKEVYRLMVAKNLLQALFDDSFVELVTVLLKDMDLTEDELARLKATVASAVLPGEKWAEITAKQPEPAAEAPTVEPPKLAFGLASVLTKNTHSVRFNRIHAAGKSSRFIQNKHRVSARFKWKKANRVYGKNNGKGCGLGQKPGFYISWIRDLRRPCEHLGLWAAGS